MAEMMKEGGEKLGKLWGGGGLVMMIRMANVQEDSYPLGTLFNVPV
jgi:hypothetical protein